MVNDWSWILWKETCFACSRLNLTGKLKCIIFCSKDWPNKMIFSVLNCMSLHYLCSCCNLISHIKLCVHTSVRESETETETQSQTWGDNWTKAIRRSEVAEQAKPRLLTVAPATLLLTILIRTLSDTTEQFFTANSMCVAVRNMLLAVNYTVKSTVSI